MRLPLRLSIAGVVSLAILVVAGGESLHTRWDPFPGLTQSKQFQRWWWSRQGREAPRRGYLRSALDRLRVEHSKIRSLSGAQPDPNDEKWINIGPTPIDVGSSQFAGRVPALAVDPGDPEHWLAGTAQGGIWETRDGGQTWQCRTDHLQSLAIGSVAFSGSDPRVVYAGSGESTFSGTSYGGLGLLKSTDGGRTWEFLESPLFDGRGISEIRVDPDDPDTLLVTSTGALSPVPDFAPSLGVFRSTDGGLHFTQLVQGQAHDLEIHPTDSERLYTGLSEIAGGDDSNGLYRSLDGGGIWQQVQGPWAEREEGVGRLEMSLSPSHPDRLVVSIQDSFTGDAGDGALLGVWKTSNAWSPQPEWEELPRLPSTARTFWYNHDISFHPTSPNLVFVAGISLWRLDVDRWRRITPFHVDQHDLTWAGNRLVVGNDGGVYSTLDQGFTWFTHNTGLTITQFYAGSLHPDNPEFLLAGSQDNGTEKWNGSDPWTFLTGGDGGPNAISRSEPDTHWALSFQRLNLLRTRNGGQSFQFATQGIDRSQAPFIGRLQGCPFDDDVFITGTNQVWRTNDFFSAQVSPVWTANSQESHEIRAAAFSNSDPTCQTYAVGTVAGELLLTQDAGQTWTDLDPQGDVPDRLVEDIVFDPIQENTLYVTLSGFDRPFSAGHVFATGNGLAPNPSWVDISPPVDIPVNVLAISPADPSHLYIGTDLGLWHSPDAGVSWKPSGPESGIPAVTIFDIKSSPETGSLVVFTHGRGAFLKAQPTDSDLSLIWDRVTVPWFRDEPAEATLRVRNRGPAPSQPFTLTIDISAPFLTAGLPDDCALLKSRIHCSIPALAVEAVRGLDFTILPSEPGQLRFDASMALPPPGDPVSANNQATLQNQVENSEAQLLIPFFEVSPLRQTGLAVSAHSLAQTSLLVRGFSQSEPTPFAVNPRGYRLSRGQHFSLLLEEIFGNPNQSVTGWIRIKSNQASVSSLFQLFGERSLDGAIAIRELEMDLYFGRLFQGQGVFRGVDAVTRLSLVNPNHAAVEAILHLVDGAGGAVVDPTPVAIEPGGQLQGTLADLFGTGRISGGFLRVQVTEGGPVAGFQLVEIDEGTTLFALNGAGVGESDLLFSAQIASTPEVFTSLKVINTAAAPRNLDFRLSADSGDALAPPVFRTLLPGATLELDAVELFDLQAPSTENVAVTGSLVITSDGPGVSGNVLFGSRHGGRTAAALPLQDRLYSSAVFSQLANGAGLFTGLALFNPGDETAQIDLQTLSSQGGVTGLTSISLPPGQRLARTLVQLVPGADDQVGGAVRLDATHPIVAQQLFGDIGLNFLSAVPATVLQ